MFGLDVFFLGTQAHTHVVFVTNYNGDLFPWMREFAGSCVSLSLYRFATSIFFNIFSSCISLCSITFLLVEAFSWAICHHSVSYFIRCNGNGDGLHCRRFANAHNFGAFININGKFFTWSTDNDVHYPIQTHTLPRARPTCLVLFACLAVFVFLFLRVLYILNDMYLSNIILELFSFFFSQFPPFSFSVGANVPAAIM